MQRQMNLLGKMLAAAEADRKDDVLRLNKNFDKIHLAEKTHMDQDLSLELDLARQSCVGVFSMPALRDVFLKDARARVSDLNAQGGK